MDRERIGTYLLRSAEETEQFGCELAHKLGPNTILAIQGDLGAGKTTFVQGLAKGLGVLDVVQSPTFTYLQIYEGSSLSLYHFDLYRLEKESDFIGLGFEEAFEAGGIVAIEWPGRIPSLIPSFAQEITFSHAEGQRVVSIGTWMHGRLVQLDKSFLNNFQRESAGNYLKNFCQAVLGRQS